MVTHAGMIALSPGSTSARVEPERATGVGAPLVVVRAAAEGAGAGELLPTYAGMIIARPGRTSARFDDEREVGAGPPLAEVFAGVVA